MASSTRDSIDPSAIFPEFAAPVDSMALNIIRSLYDELAATCDQPDKLRALVRELVQTRLKMHIQNNMCREDEKAQAELVKERSKNEELESKNEQLERKLDEKIRDMLYAETALMLEREKARAALEKLGSLQKEMDVITREFRAQARALQSVNYKRQLDEDTSISQIRPDRLKKPKLTPSPNKVACSQCYAKFWECDGEHHCQNCIARGISADGCKRVKCQFFELGTCKKRNCTLAHEEDAYRVITPHIKVQRKHVEPPAGVRKDGDE